MSKNFNKRSLSASASAIKKFCKVCHDAGKSESEYTSHFVRSSTTSDGVVVCPTLLALNCRYCGKSGHTVKFCKELDQKKKAEQRGYKKASLEKPEKKVEKKPTAFELLDEDSEDEEMEDMKISSEEIVTKKTISYADIASRPKPVVTVTKPAAASVMRPIVPLSINKPDDCENDYDNWSCDGSSLPRPVYYRTDICLGDSYLDAESECESDEEEEYVKPIGRPAPWAKNYQQQGVTSW